MEKTRKKIWEKEKTGKNEKKYREKMKKKKLGNMQKKCDFHKISIFLQKSLGLHFNSGTRTSVFNVQKTVTRSTGLR